MKTIVRRVMALCLVLCLAMPCLGGAEIARSFALIDVPETVEEPLVTIHFEGEKGVSYTLHYKYRSIWLLPVTVTLEDSTEGEFEVELGEGSNDFVLIESTQPRDALDALAFSIAYVPEPSETATPKPTAVPTPTPTPAADTAPAVASLTAVEATATVSVSPSPEATEAPTETPSPSPIPEPTATPEPEPTEEPTQAPTAVPYVAPAPTETPEPVPTEAVVTPSPEPTVDPGRDRALKLWMHGDDVMALQEGLSGLGIKYGRADGVYGPKTRAAIMRFQRRNDLKVDGVVGTATREKLSELGVEIPLYFEPDMTMPEGFERILSLGVEGMDVYHLQEALIAAEYLEGKPDQVYGVKTRKAVRAFQKENGLKEDGVAGPETLRLLMGME